MHLNRLGLLRAAAVAAIASLLVSSTARAEEAAPEPGSAYSFSSGVDFMSHFISYGADVWGGGTDSYPFANESTIFAWAQLNAAVSDEFTIYFNTWGDFNDNSDGDLGGNIQEIDLTLGATYTLDKFTFGAAFGCWNYASDEELIVDLSVAYNDAELWGDKGFALNPSFLAHLRVNGNGGQEEAEAFVLGIAPTYTFEPSADYPITLGFPVNVAFFTDEFQGGDSGYGYFSAGVTATVPLAFIPEKFGNWTASVGGKYYNTPDDAVPNNPDEDFFVTNVSVGMSF